MLCVFRGRYVAGLQRTCNSVPGPSHSGCRLYRGDWLVRLHKACERPRWEDARQYASCWQLAAVSCPLWLQQLTQCINCVYSMLCNFADFRKQCSKIRRRCCCCCCTARSCDSFDSLQQFWHLSC